MALTKNDARLIVGMAARGDKHHDMAAYFGENQARIAEVLSGEMFGHVEAAPAAELPPKGAPGIKGRRVYAHLEKALAALDAGNIDEAKETLAAGAKRWNLHE
ncbi:hypothetical protein [Mesorhizobium delmotii]|uniref:Uncharacterized protein n=1 Tax=Mesorhizobium delmotii TaxID=1631247 RepID=A0A2P9AFP9_9HYPH|nr:hypothetical protein [Mesorhizobium delmotii]SJM29972.1 conserved hypothetical protein [Mesorhizobium delmotii]